MNRQRLSRLNCLADSLGNLRSVMLSKNVDLTSPVVSRFRTQMALTVQQRMPAAAAKGPLDEYLPTVPGFPGWPDSEGAFRYPIVADACPRFSVFCRWNRVRMIQPGIVREKSYQRGVATWIFCDAPTQWRTCFHRFRIDQGGSMLHPVEGILLLQMYPELLAEGQEMLVECPGERNEAVVLRRNHDGDECWIELGCVSSRRMRDQVVIPVKHPGMGGR